VIELSRSGRDRQAGARRLAGHEHARTAVGQQEGGSVELRRELDKGLQAHLDVVGGVRVGEVGGRTDGEAGGEPALVATHHVEGLRGIAGLVAAWQRLRDRVLGARVPSDGCAAHDDLRAKGHAVGALGRAGRG
jgi:hypothetical protein